MFAIDPQGIVTHCNPAAETLTGWTRGELIGHELPFDPQGPIHGKNGRPIDCAIWIAAIRAPQGPARGKVIIAAGSAALREAGLELVTSTPSRSQF